MYPIVKNHQIKSPSLVLIISYFSINWKNERADLILKKQWFLILQAWQDLDCMVIHNVSHEQ